MRAIGGPASCAGPRGEKSRPAASSPATRRPWIQQRVGSRRLSAPCSSSCSGSSALPPGNKQHHDSWRTRPMLPIPSGEIAIFEPSGESIDFIAEGNTGFVLGSAAKHPHGLVLGNYSVHTSAEALREGEAEIRRIGQDLRANGTLRR